MQNRDAVDERQRRQRLSCQCGSKEERKRERVNRSNVYFLLLFSVLSAMSHYHNWLSLTMTGFLFPLWFLYLSYAVIRRIAGL